MLFDHKYLPNYSYDEYCKWEGNWELIDGIPWAIQNTQDVGHQIVNGNLTVIFKDALKTLSKLYKNYISIPWKISESTIILPDTCIINKKVEGDYLDFTPQLVAEILSPSTAVKDRNIKKEIYLSQKVKYFLILDPQLKKLEIYELLNDTYSPVSISPNNFAFTFEDGCTADVDFEDIWD